MSINHGLEDAFIIKNNKKLRMGYTTGSCAAGAAKAAVEMLLGKIKIAKVELMTPKGISLCLKIEEIEQKEESVRCAIRKDGGDDPDDTNGVLVYALVKKIQKKGIEKSEIIIEGGVGVGRVTKAGLQQPIGAAAINEVPRRMILEAVSKVCEAYAYQGSIYVEISIPQGIEIAKRTFNQRLGIEGGLSILGTSGIVIPMSEDALIESIRVEMKMLAANGMEYLLITPGNYGELFSKKHWNLDGLRSMKCSNYVGETIDIAIELGIKGILFIAHIGKFIKVAGGIMNTHSKCADARAELMAANALRAGVSAPIARKILDTITTDEALGILKEEGLLEETMGYIMQKVQYYLEYRAYDHLQIGSILFSNVYGELGQTRTVSELLGHLNIKKSI